MCKFIVYYLKMLFTLALANPFANGNTIAIFASHGCFSIFPELSAVQFCIPIGI